MAFVIFNRMNMKPLTYLVGGFFVLSNRKSSSRCREGELNRPSQGGSERDLRLK